MLRFYTVIITHLFSCIRFIFGLKKIIKHKERYSEKEKYLLALKSNREKDIERGFTSCGVHRDDIYFFISTFLF